LLGEKIKFLSGYRFGLSLTEDKYANGRVIEYGYQGLWKSIAILGIIALVVAVYVI
jgi:hypothetical protein